MKAPTLKAWVVGDNRKKESETLKVYCAIGCPLLSSRLWKKNFGCAKVNSNSNNPNPNVAASA
jgi:hypothetical protein